MAIQRMEALPKFGLIDVATNKRIEKRRAFRI
jgi:hypothetical protein